MGGFVVDNRYIKGVLTGVGSSFLAIILIIIIVLGINSGRGSNNGDGKDGTDDGNGFFSSIKDMLTNDKADTDESFQKKKEHIKDLVSKQYIYEVAEEDYRIAELRALMSALGDPYSCYYTKEEFSALLESSSGEYSGIGALCSQDGKTGLISIVRPFVDGPAYNAGILPGDVIYKVEGEETAGKDINAVVSAMKGPEGTTVSIEVVREGASMPIKFVITRGKIQVPTVEYQMLDDGIGYIYVMEFDQVTSGQFISIVDKMINDGAKGLVIDLRDNPGGLLNVVVDMLDRLLPDGMIVYTEDKNGKGDEYKSSDREQVNIPMAVLINGYSASASEIFAAALQDYEMAVIVGTRSFGKGIVQSLLTLGDGSAIKLTTSRYFTPKGRSIHGEGVIPDVVVELDEGLAQMVNVPIGEDNQVQAAVEAIKGR